MSPQVIELCDEGLCMHPAVARVTVSNGDDKVTCKVCESHRDELRTKVEAANAEPGAQLGLEVVPLPIARVA